MKTAICPSWRHSFLTQTGQVYSLPGLIIHGGAVAPLKGL
jgi:hypothetical protein